MMTMKSDQTQLHYNWEHYKKVIHARKKKGLSYSELITLTEEGEIISYSFIDPKTKRVYLTISNC